MIQPVLAVAAWAGVIAMVLLLGYGWAFWPALPLAVLLTLVWVWLRRRRAF